MTANDGKLYDRVKISRMGFNVVGHYFTRPGLQYDLRPLSSIGLLYVAEYRKLTERTVYGQQQFPCESNGVSTPTMPTAKIQQGAKIETTIYFLSVIVPRCKVRRIYSR